MRLIQLLLCLVFLVGCGQQSLEEQTEKKENEVAKLLAGAKKIQVDLVKSRKDYTDRIAKCDEMLAKLDTLLGVKPLPLVVVPPVVVPAVVPPLVVTPVIPPVVPPVIVPPVVVPVTPVDGRFAVATAVWKIAQAVGSPDRDAEAKALADVFAGVAKDVRENKLEGSLLDPQWRRISLALTAGNKPILAKHLSAWDEPATQLSKKIAFFYKEGRLAQNEDWADLLDEIALGLRFRSK